MKVGTLEIVLKEAKLTRDLETFGKMDPYAILILKDQTIKSSVKNGAGKNPVWNEKFNFRCEETEDITIKIMEKETISKDDIIGENSIKMIANDYKEKQQLNLPIFFKGKQAGEVLIELLFYFQGKNEKIIIEKEGKKLTKENEELKEKIRVLTEEKNNANTKADNCSNQMNSLKNELDKLIKENQDLLNKINEGNLDKARADIFDKMKNDNQNLKKQIEEMEKEIAALKATIKNLKENSSNTETKSIIIYFIIYLDFSRTIQASPNPREIVNYPMNPANFDVIYCSEPYCNVCTGKTSINPPIQNSFVQPSYQTFQPTYQPTYQPPVLMQSYQPPIINHIENPVMEHPVQNNFYQTIQPVQNVQPAPQIYENYSNPTIAFRREHRRNPSSPSSIHPCPVCGDFEWSRHPHDHAMEQTRMNFSVNIYNFIF